MCYIGSLLDILETYNNGFTAKPFVGAGLCLQIPQLKYNNGDTNNIHSGQLKSRTNQLKKYIFQVSYIYGNMM